MTDLAPSAAEAVTLPWQSYSPSRIELAFADGTYTFRLPWRLIAELQRTCGVEVRWGDGGVGRREKGLGQIWAEVRERAYNVRDLREVVRLGLIGGGGGVTVGGDRVVVDASRAVQLIEVYVDGGGEDDAVPTDGLWNLAFAILAATIQGYGPLRHGSPLGKAAATNTAEETAPTGGSTSPPLSETA